MKNSRIGYCTIEELTSLLFIIIIIFYFVDAVHSAIHSVTQYV